MRHRLLLLALLLLAGFAPARAQNSPRWTPSATVEADVRADLAQRWGVDAAAVALEWGTLAGAAPDDASAAVQSGAGSSWIVAFRNADGRQTGTVRLRAGTRIHEWVAAREIDRGETVTAEHIATRVAVRWGTPAAPAASPEGWVTRRRITAGEPLATPAVSAPEMVRAGDQVRLTVESGSVVLTVSATALGSGSLGARVAVRTDGGKRIDTLITGPGEVRLRGSER